MYLSIGSPPATRFVIGGFNISALYNYLMKESLTPYSLNSYSCAAPPVLWCEKRREAHAGSAKRRRKVGWL